MFTIGQAVKTKSGEAGIVIGKRFRLGKPELRIKCKATVVWATEADCESAVAKPAEQRGKEVNQDEPKK